MEPVAIIGLGCRFAGGADSPEQFWDLLIAGRDGIGSVPPDRWLYYRDRSPDDEDAVRGATERGGFLTDIAGFDTAFFGVSPREAELMDPQQRILLEVAWEALEHAGIPPRDLAGSDTGVFVGIGSDDYGRRLLEDLPTIEAWTGIGSAVCAAANRVSYAFDLHGPSLAVDTACSASLVAAHLACQSLRAGESTLALVGGVNLIVSPGLTLTLDAAGATAPDGRCKPFDAEANGYGRGEGAGFLVLKLLADAERDGDRVLSVIRGSHVSQDGRTNGIMAPNGEAQGELLTEACRRASVAPETVDYVEAHGTGTRLGDPLEAAALSRVYGRTRPAGDPLLLGSVKSTIGHLEAGAGVAGLIKATLALDRAEIPATTNVRTLNPAVDWAEANLHVVRERTPWPEHDRPRRAGVSGFGYGGTIAHVLLEEAPSRARPATAGVSDAGSARLFPLSARSPQALREQAVSLMRRLGDEPASLDDLGHTLATRRSHLEHRAAVVAADPGELLAGLQLVADGEAGPRVSSGSVPAAAGAGLVWVFSGHGSQWTGMGRELMHTSPAFAAVLDEIEPVFQSEIGFSPRQVLLDGAFDTVDRIQTMIFVMQVGLAAVWHAAGVRPDLIIGHSVGEIAAAVEAGGLSLTDGARLICRRSRLLRRVAGRGAMAMVGLPFAEVAARLDGDAEVCAAIAASPLSTVVSGSPEAVEALVQKWQTDEVQVRRVASDVAFHSAQMDELTDELTAAAADLQARVPAIPMYSTALRDARSTPAFDGAYWAVNLRSPVLLAQAVQAAAEDGHTVFIEISAHPVVAHSIGETLGELGLDDTFVGTSLRRGKPETETLLAAVGTAHCHGVTVDWRTLQPAGDLVDLPGPAWQRQPHWREPATERASRDLRHNPESHALLGGQVPLPETGMRLWRTLLDADNRPYPGSHTIEGTEVIPAAVLLNTFLRTAGTSVLPVLRDVELRVPLVAAERREVQVMREGAAVRLSSLAGDETGTGGWVTHTTATLTTAGVDPAGPTAAGPPADRRAARFNRIDAGEVRRHLTAMGVPSMAFEWSVLDLWRGVDHLRARVRIDTPADDWAPALDAALSIAPVAFAGAPVLRMVAHLDEMRLSGPPPAFVQVDIVIDRRRPGVVDVAVTALDGDGRADLAGLRYGGAQQERPTRPAASLVHEIGWKPLTVPPAGPDRPGRNVVVVGDAALADRFGTGLVTAVADPGDLPTLDGDTDVVVAAPPPAPDEPVPAAVERSVRLLLRTAQALAGRDVTDSLRLWAVTTGVRESADRTGLAQAGMWGLGRVLAGELGDRWGGVIDLEPDGARLPGTVAGLLAVLPPHEVIAVRDDQMLVSRLMPTDRPIEREGLSCSPAASYLITGGLGVLGLRVARRLVELGARRIVLAGRTGIPPRARWADLAAEDSMSRVVAGIRDLEGLGVTVRVVTLDITDPDAARRALDPDALGLPAVRGVVHAAGVLDNRLATGVDDASLHTVLRPKTAGTWVLHELFPPGSLDFFVLFSSCGHLLGLPGQATYGAANAFLDAFAAYRNGPDSADTTALAWTSWRGMGMAVNEAVDLELAARGVTDISAIEAFAAWDHATRSGARQAVVLATTGTEVAEEVPVLRDVYDVAPAANSPAEAETTLAGLSGPQLRDELLREVSSQVAAEMRLPVAALDARRSLSEQGLDSVMTVVIRRRLEKRFGHRLPATLLWQRPTVSAIVDHLAEQLVGPTD
ncbi:type I polyketide synthase [Actinoplanes auranticolor]|uniref:Phthiocerol synthesis polyketide synthase type I PpsA n=1 Tax=Actinoplanes auranticolor TaxID=47988 RepID=A0A919VU80_9ACTN|nr:type I polyketide synthase [Actinoplanes auranticolor]GIM79104.1 phthiocerol synthesis polyketide synthase type I PpsA [Actinoplanes auranticolor]